MKTTNWSQPHTNLWKAVRSLQRALAAGQIARLVRMRNEDCEHPILCEKANKDFRNYKFACAYPQTRNGILEDVHKTDFQKHLSLNYRTCYGTQEALDRYYKKGLLSPDNFRGVGVSHLVHVKDLIRFHHAIGDHNYAQMFAEQYYGEHTANDKHFFDNYVSMDGSEYAPKRFRRKLWVVELYHGHDAREKRKAMRWTHRLISWIQSPLKYIPKKSVLRMDEYRVVTYRVGDVTNGLSICFHIPKKFGFN